MGCSTSISAKVSAWEISRRKKVSIVLSGDEKAIIVETWKLIEPYQRIVGKTLFMRFFEERPSYQDLFPEFSSLSREQIKTTSALYGHARRVMKAIENAVISMDDIQIFTAYLEDLGRRHEKRALKPIHLVHMQDAFIYAIRQVLTSQWSSDTSMAWNKLFRFVADTMIQGCKT